MALPSFHHAVSFLTIESPGFGELYASPVQFAGGLSWPMHVKKRLPIELTWIEFIFPG
jgi:hypothetical protein